MFFARIFLIGLLSTGSIVNRVKEFQAVNFICVYIYTDLYVLTHIHRCPPRVQHAYSY